MVKGRKNWAITYTRQHTNFVSFFCNLRSTTKTIHGIQTIRQTLYHNEHTVQCKPIILRMFFFTPSTYTGSKKMVIYLGITFSLAKGGKTYKSYRHKPYTYVCDFAVNLLLWQQKTM